MQEEQVFSVYVIEVVQRGALAVQEGEVERFATEKSKPLIPLTRALRNGDIFKATFDYLYDNIHQPFNSVRDKDLSEVTELVPEEDLRRICGLIRKGPYGRLRRIQDINTKEKTDIGPEKAVLETYFFDFHFPARYDRGLLICQARGQGSIAALIEESLRKYYYGIDPNVTVRIDRFTPSDYIEKLIRKQAQIKSLTFTQYRPPAESIEALEGFGILSEIGSIEYKLIPKKNHSFRGLFPGLSGKGSGKLGGFDRLVPANIDPESLKIELQIGSRRRSFKVQNHEFAHASFDEMMEIVPGTGLPSLNDLSEVSARVARDVYDDMYSS